VRQTIEEALIAELKRLLSRELNPGGGYLQAVDEYNGDLDDADGPDDFIRALRGRSPVILVTAAGSSLSPESVTRRRWRRLISFELYVASNHSRTREHRTRSDVVADGDPTADPGIYQIIEDVQQILSGNDLGLTGVGPLSPRREDVLLQEPGFTVWRLVYDSATDAHVPPHGFADRQLTDYQINGNLVDGDGETVLPEPPNPLAEADGDLTP
jgi:phage gp37-like protein